jgi:hypothetical protein
MAARCKTLLTFLPFLDHYSHGLMQAIARVNRVFKDKPGGLVVDYLGIAAQLKLALADYTEKDRGQAGISQEEADAILLEQSQMTRHLQFEMMLLFSKPYEQLSGKQPQQMGRLKRNWIPQFGSLFQRHFQQVK